MTIACAETITNIYTDSTTPRLRCARAPAPKRVRVFVRVRGFGCSCAWSKPKAEAEDSEDDVLHGQPRLERGGDRGKESWLVEHGACLANLDRYLP
jgi:hypothetical protein